MEKSPFVLENNQFLVFISGIFPYDYAKKDTGEKKVGCSLSCSIFDEAALNRQKGERGARIEELVVSQDMQRSVSQLGWYRGTFSFYQWRTGGKAEWRRRLVRLELLEPVAFPAGLEGVGK